MSGPRWPSKCFQRKLGHANLHPNARVSSPFRKESPAPPEASMTRLGGWDRACPGRKAERCACAGRAPRRLGGSAPRVCGSGSGLLSSLSLCSRLRGTRPQSPDPSGRPRGYPGARRLGPAASGRSLVSAASLPRAGPASSSSTERPVTR